MKGNKAKAVTSIRRRDSDVEAASSDRRPRRLILIFSDQMKSGDPCFQSLEAYGYQVSISANADGMSGGPLQFKPEAIVVDLQSERDISQSLDTIRRLKEEGRLKIPVIFIGDRENGKMRIGTVRAGIASFMNRPVTPLALVECLDRLTMKNGVPYRIMLVDDSRTQARYMSEILKQASMDTFVVNDFSHVMSGLESFRPELIIMDLSMPEVSGDEIVSVIRQEEDFATIPIIYVSAEHDLDRQSRAMMRGGDDFITKPFVPERFIDSILHRVKRFRQLRKLVEKDSLTGLVNHSHTFRLIEHWYEKSKASGDPCTYAIFDIDHFKKVNDTWGHDAGDQVIKSLSRCLRERTRDEDIAGRIGGEEFACILPDTDVEGAMTLTNWLREDFSNIYHASGELNFQCTVSVGVGLCSDFGNELDLRNAADAALYESKNNGRNRVTLATPDQVVKTDVA